MEIDIDIANVEKGLKQLFAYAFTTNCSIDEESMTSEESQTLMDLTSSEILENLKVLILSLLAFKREFKNTDQAELVQRSEQFETLLQKLEAEVRSHIRVEHQLKLHLENHQQRIDELEKAESAEKNSKKELEEKDLAKKPKKIDEKVKKEYDEKMKGLVELMDRKDKQISKLEFENSKLKNLLEEKVKEFESAKKEISKLAKSAVKWKEPALNEGEKKELKKVPSFKSQTGLQKTERKSVGESDLLKLKNLAESKKDSKKEEVKGSKIGVKKHARSNSDTKLLSSKKII